MKIRELAAATRDLEQALDHYAAINPDLAAAMLHEVRLAQAMIARFPHAWHPLGSKLRRYALHRYPYSIIYRASPSEILIVAYAHFRRQPGYWRQRT